MFRQKRKEPKEEHDGKRSALQNAFDLPTGALAGFPQIALSGNREAVVEGCTGVLEYSDTRIRLGFGKMMLQFTGRNLQIRCMSGENVIVDGFFTGIEFQC